MLISGSIALALQTWSKLSKKLSLQITVRPHSRSNEVRQCSSSVLIGGLCAVAGVAAAVGVHWHPEQLNVPAWVAYAACLAFVFAGLSVVAREFALGRLASWLVVAFMAALVLTAVWVAFGPGSRECSVSFAQFAGVASDWLCRGVFGFGALVGAALLVWLFRRALESRNVA
jgi:hypothetical protein